MRTQWSGELYPAFVAASAALVVLPGPNVAPIVANSVAHGRRYGLLTVAGTSAAMVPQLALTTLGMTGALTIASQVFEWVRRAGGPTSSGSPCGRGALRART